MRYVFSQANWPERTALFIAHPGHELRIWHWLGIVRPVTLVVTDGSGRAGTPRLARTLNLLERVGAQRSHLFGAISDRQLYDAVLCQRTDLFRDLVDQTARQLVDARVECVVGDAAEGQIMAHDLLREVRVEAVKRAREELGRDIVEYEFTIDAHPSFVPTNAKRGARLVPLTAEELRRKVQFSRGYLEIADVVAHAFGQFGERAFDVECLFPSLPQSCLPSDTTAPRAYEKHGEKQVNAGSYSEVIRYHEHVEPILRTLRPQQPRAAA